MSDREQLERALELAERGRGTTHPNPVVGAVVVRDGVVVGEGWHERAGGPHAEVVALAAAGERARGATLYVTLEPCAMCAGALVLGRVDRVVFGARDPKAGMVVSLGALLTDPRLNHRCRLREGVLADETGGLLSAFFRSRRVPPD